MNLNTLHEHKEFLILLEMAIAQLEEKLSLHPENINLLWRLAELNRQKGSFTKASIYYKKILDNASKHTHAEYLYNILSGNINDGVLNEPFIPVPFKVFSNFLPENELNLIWDFIEGNQHLFQEARVSTSNENSPSINKSVRQANVVKKKELKPISSFFLPKVLKTYNSCKKIFQIPEFESDYQEIQLTSYSDKQFFKVHKDTVKEGIASRKITFVYYFFKEPKQFSGGDLLLFDTDYAKTNYGSAFSRVIPKNNTLLLFPSNYYHQVTPVSMETKNIASIRFSLNGWLNKNVW